MEGAKGKGKPKGKAAAAANESVLKQSRRFAFNSYSVRSLLCFWLLCEIECPPGLVENFFSSRWIEEVH